MSRWNSALPGGLCPPLPQGSGPGGWYPCLGLLLVLLCACAQLLCLPFVEWGEEWDDVGGRRRLPYLAFLVRALDAFPCTYRWAISMGSQDSREAAKAGIIILMIAIIICIS